WCRSVALRKRGSTSPTGSKKIPNSCPGGRRSSHCSNRSRQRGASALTLRWPTGNRWERLGVEALDMGSSPLQNETQYGKGKGDFKGFRGGRAQERTWA